MKLVACSLQLENQYILMTGKIYPLAVLGIQRPLAVLVLNSLIIDSFSTERHHCNWF